MRAQHARRVDTRRTGTQVHTRRKDQIVCGAQRTARGARPSIAPRCNAYYACIYIYIYIERERDAYIYIYIERERERCVQTCMCIYIYILQ